MRMGVSKYRNLTDLRERVGMITNNYQGYPMKCVEYTDSHNIVVEFQDEYKAKINTTYYCFLNGQVKNPYYRLGEAKLNNQGCSMKIVEYSSANNIVVEFKIITSIEQTQLIVVLSLAQLEILIFLVFLASVSLVTNIQ